MMWLQWLIFSVSIALQVRVLGSLRSNGYREYPFVFIYSLVLLLTVLAEAIVRAGVVSLPLLSMDSQYYRSEAVRQFLLFTVVVSLIERAMPETLPRTRVRSFLAVIAVVSVFVSLMIHSGAPTFGLWMTQVSRDLSFGSVVLTLLLWVLLISSRKRDRRLLIVTVGLGLQFTGEAIGQSLRQIAYGHHSRGTLLAGNILHSVAHLIRLYIWLEAFRTTTKLPEMRTEVGGAATAPLGEEAEAKVEKNAAALGMLQIFAVGAGVVEPLI